MSVRYVRAPRAGRVRSLRDLLQGRADAQPDDRAYTFLVDGEREGERMTWGDLEVRSRTVASAIAERVRPGDRVLILFPPSLDFVPAFFGALAAGTIAIPCYPPRLGRNGDSDARDRTLERLRSIARDARPSLVLAAGALAARAFVTASLVPELAGIEWLSADQRIDAHARELPAIQLDNIAFLQYTSGSTAEPRGVIVTQGNLLHNLADAQGLARHARTSASVSWLPVIHDMGLIQGILQPAFSGFPAWLMAPSAFLQRPARWLQAISRAHATISGGPNFAYELCLRRIGSDERSALDLKSWRFAFNGAEPIRQRTLDAFAAAFAPCGFASKAFRPSYGLAEATLLVTTGQGATTCCGNPAPSTQVRIVDPVTRCECPAGSPGEIWVAGPGVTAGYWEQPEQTAATFHARMINTNEGPFLRTGDLGSLMPDGLHVTARMKDLVIVRGVKHFPQDLEDTVERACPALRAGCCAAFAVPGVHGDIVGVVAELDAGSAHDRHALESSVESVRQAIGEAHGIPVGAVALVTAGTIPKTTSGKLQRYACREAMLAGRLSPVWIWMEAALLAEAS